VITLGPVTSTNGTTYTAAQVLGLLVSGVLQMRWLFDLLGPQGTPKVVSGTSNDLTPYILYDSAPKIAHDSTRAVKRQLTLQMRAVAAVNPLQDLMKVRSRVTMPDGGEVEWTIGLFMFTPPRRTITEGYTRWDVTLPDLSQLLSDDAFSTSTAVAAGTNHASAVAALVDTYAGPTTFASQVPDRGTTLPASLGWDAGTSRLKAINDVLNSISYVPAWVRGQPLISYPQPDYTLATPSVTFDVVAGGPIQLQGPFQQEADYSNAYNQFRVVGQDPRREAVSAYYENDRPDSPISVQNWHPRLKPPIQDSSLADTAACLARAKTEAQLAARIFQVLTVNTVPFPFFEDLDVVRLTFSAADEGTVAFNYVVVAGTHTLQAGASTQGRLQRIVPS
jgi:hypothetical protein